MTHTRARLQQNQQHTSCTDLEGEREPLHSDPLQRQINQRENAGFSHVSPFEQLNNFARAKPPRRSDRAKPADKPWLAELARFPINHRLEMCCVVALLLRCGSVQMARKQRL